MKLRVDFLPAASLRVSMTTVEKLVEQLLNKAGMVMEDSSPAAILADGAMSRSERIAIVRSAAKAALALADAADVVLRLASEA